MNLNERAKIIIEELIAVPREMWVRSNESGQVYYSVEGHAGLALYFSRTLMNPDVDHPFCEEAMEVYEARLGDKSFAVEIFDDERRCVCLLRWTDIDDIEVAEYKHGAWELVSFSLPPIDRDRAPTIH